jgi:hypothetical protein
METFSIARRGIHFTNAAGLPAQEKAGRLGSELSCSVIDTQTAQNLIDTAIQFIPMAKE